MRVTALIPQNSYMQGWGLHVWGNVTNQTNWNTPQQPTGLGREGPYWDIKLQTSANHVGVLIHKGEEKAAGARLSGCLHGTMGSTLQDSSCCYTGKVCDGTNLQQCMQLVTSQALRTQLNACH